MLKNCFYDGFEDQSFLLTTIPENLTYDFFTRHFVELSILLARMNFQLPDVQASMNWRCKIRRVSFEDSLAKERLQSSNPL